MANGKNSRPGGADARPASGPPPPEDRAKKTAGDPLTFSRLTAKAPPPPARLATRQESGTKTMINGRPSSPGRAQRVSLKVVKTSRDALGSSALPPPRKAKKAYQAARGKTGSDNTTRREPTLKTTIKRTAFNPVAQARPAPDASKDQTPHGTPAQPGDAKPVQSLEAPAAAPATGPARPPAPPATQQSPGVKVDAGPDKAAAGTPREVSPSEGSPRDDAEPGLAGTVMPGRPIVTRKARPSEALPERPLAKKPGEAGTLPPQILRAGKEKSTIVNPFTKKRRVFSKPTGRPLAVTFLLALAGVMIWQSGLFDERVDALFDGPKATRQAATEPAPLETAAPKSSSDQDAEADAVIGETPAEAIDPVDTQTSRRVSTAVLQPPAATAPAHPFLQNQELDEVVRLLGRLDLLPAGASSDNDQELADAIALFQEMAGLEVSGRADRSLLDELRTVVGMMRDNP